MVYNVVFLASAQKELRKIDKQNYRKIRQAIDTLAHNPRPSQSRKMINRKNTWRLRVGNYRILYEILDKEILVLIVKIGHRREIYR